ncbi:MAG: lysophospholipid acyltransferase family protein [Elusimicrobia bacterium]|nr:lysophospholipid acyltransferase family protein [Elusimicrobiota bacterium]
MRDPSSCLYNLFGSLAGKEFADSVVRKGLALLFRNLRMGREIRGNLRRVLSYTRKREPEPAELDSIIDEMAGLYARSLINQFSFVPHEDHRAYEGKAEPELLPVLKGLLAEKRGAILASPHFGDTLLMAISLADLGVPLSFMSLYAEPGRPAAGPARNLRFISVGWAAAHCLRALRDNETVLLLADIEYFPDGRTMDFFGAPFTPPQGIAKLALAAQAPILPVYPVFRGGRHHLVCDEPIRLDGEPSPEDLERRILRSMESAIGRYPAHWFVFSDMWDLEAAARKNRQAFRELRFRERLDSWLGGRRGKASL